MTDSLYLIVLFFVLGAYASRALTKLFFEARLRRHLQERTPFYFNDDAVYIVSSEQYHKFLVAASLQARRDAERSAINEVPRRKQ